MLLLSHPRTRACYRCHTTQHITETIGLYYYGARWYDASRGRFIQPDAIVPEPGNPQNLDRYAYALNNPVKYSDPTGHAFEEGTGGGGVDPLTREQKDISRQAADTFGIPYPLVASTVAVEIVDDTDWIDKPLDVVLQEIPLQIHYAEIPDLLIGPATDAFLTGYEHYFGLFGERGPGNGIANVHAKTAKEAEAYFAGNYPDEHLLDAPPDHYARSATLLSDEGNIHYTAAVLRRNADYRTGTKGSHLDDLSMLDMQMVYGRYRCECWKSWEDYEVATEIPSRSRGFTIVPYVQLYSIGR